jgi:hypothetical protein
MTPDPNAPAAHAGNPKPLHLFSYDSSSAAHPAVAVCHHSLAFWSVRFFSLYQGFYLHRLSLRKVRSTRHHPLSQPPQQ